MENTSDLHDLPEQLSDTDMNLQNGGFFWGSYNKVNAKALEAAFKGDGKVLEVLITEDLITNYGAKDSTGSTVLHYLAKNKDLDPTGKLKELVINKDKSLLDVKDNKGVTPKDILNTKNNSDNNCSMTESPMNREQVDKFVKELIKNVVFSPNNTTTPVTFVYTEKNKSTVPLTETEELIQKIKQDIYSNNSVSPSETENVFKIFKNKQTGGKKSKHNYSETSDKLSRMIKNQASEIHEQVVKDIETILNKNKTKFKDVNLAAKAIKAHLWNTVKEKFGELSNLDKANKLKEMVTEQTVLDIENKNKDRVEELMNIIKTKTSERESKLSSTEKKPEKKTTEKTSDKKSDKKSTEKKSDKKQKRSKKINKSEHGFSATSSEYVTQNNAYSETTVDKNMFSTTSNYRPTETFSTTSLNSYY